MSQAQAWLVTVTFINTCHCFPRKGGPWCCSLLVLVSKDDKLFHREAKSPGCAKFYYWCFCELPASHVCMSMKLQI